MSYQPVTRDSTPDSSPSLPQQQSTDIPANQYRPHHGQHHHKHHHHDEEEERRIKDSTYSFWFCALITLAVVGLFIFVIIYFPVTAQSNNQHFEEIDNQLNDRSTTHFSNNGIHSVSENDRGGGGEEEDEESRFSFCHHELYHVSGKGRLENVINPLLIENGASDMNPDLARGDGKRKKEMAIYSIEVFLQIRYNVESDSLTSEERGKGKEEEEEDSRKYKRYFLIHYEISSTFPEFSSIRLIESILPSHSTFLKTNRDLLLCSNNPSHRLKTPHCSQLIHLNRTLSFPDLTLTNPPKSRKETKKEEEEDWNEEEEGEREEKKKKEEERVIRVYQLHFYRESDDGEESRFREYVITSIEPNHCKN